MTGLGGPIHGPLSRRAGGSAEGDGRSSVFELATASLRPSNAKTTPERRRDSTRRPSCANVVRDDRLQSPCRLRATSGWRMASAIRALALSVAVALPACATLDRGVALPEQSGPGPCLARVCAIVVTVKECVVAIDDPEKVVPRENRRPTLRFRLAPGSRYRYTFAQDSIEFRNDPGGQMRPLGRTFPGDQFDVIDINDAPGTYPYRLRVTPRFRGACAPVNGTVTNG